MSCHRPSARRLCNAPALPALRSAHPANVESRLFHRRDRSSLEETASYSYSTRRSAGVHRFSLSNLKKCINSLHSEEAGQSYEIPFAVVMDAINLLRIEPHAFRKFLYLSSVILPFRKINSSQYSVSEHSFSDISSLLTKSALLCAYLAS